MNDSQKTPPSPYTICTGCVFAEMGSSSQISCRLNRATKLGIQDKEDGCFVLKRVCSTFRPEEWLKDLSIAESENIVDTVRKEVHPPVGFFVLLKTEDTEEIDRLKFTLEDIKNQELITPNYVIVITDKVEYNEQAFSLLDSMFDYKQTKYHVVQLEIDTDNPHLKIDEAFRHAENGGAYVTSSGESVPTGLLRRIDKRINEDMKKLVVVTPYDDGINGLLFQTTLFKFVNGNKSKLYGDEVEDHRPFLEKVKDASQKSNDGTFITWSEFNES